MACYELDKALEIAIASEDDDMITLALGDGASPNVLMFGAIHHKKGSWMKQALDAGADPKSTYYGIILDASSAKNYPAIFLAHHKFSAEVMDAVFDKFPNLIDLTDADDKTVTMHAVRQGRVEEIEYYLNRNADPLFTGRGRVSAMRMLEDGNTVKDKDAFVRLLKTMLQKIHDRKAAPPLPLQIQVSTSNASAAASNNEKIDGSEQITTTAKRTLPIPGKDM